MNFGDFQLYSSVMAFVWAFVVSVFAIPSIIHLAHKKDLLDEPNVRTVHRVLTPRLGGLAIFAGVVSALTIFGDFGTPNSDLQFILAGCILMFFVGLKDDIEPVSAFKKFFIQLCAASVVIVLGGVKITSLHGVLGVYEIPAEYSVMLTFLVIVGLTNAVNLIDGLDGLAGVLIVIMAGAFGYFFLSIGSVYCVLAFSLIGAVIGFLRYNLFRAEIFMGDTGSLVCGFLISVMAIELSETTLIGKSPALVLAILIVPVVDTIRVFGLRIISGKSPFTPDKNHVHHVLMRQGFSSLQVVILLGLFNLFCLITVSSLGFLANKVLVIGMLVFMLLSILFVELINLRGNKD